VISTAVMIGHTVLVIYTAVKSAHIVQEIIVAVSVDNNSEKETKILTSNNTGDTKKEHIYRQNIRAPITSLHVCISDRPEIHRSSDC